MTVAPRYAASDDLEATGLALPLQLPPQCQQQAPAQEPAAALEPDAQGVVAQAGSAPAPLPSVASLHR